MRYDRFHLVLMATHACNLQCDYCYTGSKFHRLMPPHIGRAAIHRAVQSLRPEGCLELGFFGGEPLLQAAVIAEWIESADAATSEHGNTLRLGLTTNGTIISSAAWDLMLRPDLELCVSHDGLPEVHDRHRRRGQQGTAMQVAETIEKLIAASRAPRVVMVVRPDTAASLPDGIDWLWNRGVRRFDLSLDVWSRWDRAGLESLESGLKNAAALWQERLPEIAVNWFDEKAGRLLGLPAEASARCRFGEGEIAVAPSGNLYPCERLIGEDAADNPMRLNGHVLHGDDFCLPASPHKRAAECSGCLMQQQCGTFCRCSNFLRTGDVHRPDALLCFVDRVCVRETARVLKRLVPNEADMIEVI